MSPRHPRPPSPVQQETEFARALHDFVPVTGSTTCLSFEAGQVIRTLNKDGSGWWDGELDGKRGWFPSNYVEIITAAREVQQPASVAMSAAGSAESGRSEGTRARRTLGSLNRVSNGRAKARSVISSVRTVLSSTDCLTRESKILKLHPSLVAERKRILGSLASLVNQARRASSPTSADDERGRDTDRMLDLADAVEANVKVFLGVAARLGVRLAEQDMAADDVGRAASVMRNPVEKVRPDLRSARSTGDLRNARRPALRVVADTGLFVESGPATPALLTSDTATDSSSSTAGPATPGNQALVVRTTDHLVKILTNIYDELLSTIAAFVGHVHNHDRASHSSSYAYLIDLTRETIEKVREVLVVVEAVSSHRDISRGKASELAVLSGSREALYVATTALVTAARVATSAPVGNDEDEEHQALLSSATAVLRSGGDCVGAVRLCIAGRAPTFSLELYLPDLGRPAPPHEGGYEYSAKAAIEPEDRSSEALLEEDAPTSRRRGPHTLSMLGRKATSLSCLRDQYQVDGGVSSVAEEVEPEEDDENAFESLRNVPSPHQGGTHSRKQSQTSTVMEGIASARSSPTTMGGSSRGGISHSRNSSRTSSRGGEGRVASVPMSRGDSSRTSESAASSRSGISHASTTGTSPRSSVSQVVGAEGGKSMDGSSFSSAPPSLPPQHAGQAVQVRKDDSSWFLERDYEAREISFNPEGHVTGGTLRCLIERMTLHDTTIDPTFANTFFLTFRMFTKPLELCEALYKRFELVPPQGLRVDELKQWNDSKATPVRLRIYNLLKTWVESYWQPESDTIVIDSLLAFSRGPLAASMTSASQRLIDLVQKRALTRDSDPAQAQPRTLVRMASTDRLKVGKAGAVVADPYSSPNPNGPPPPSPIVSRSLLSSLRTATRTSLSIIDIDPLELARQLTIMESRLYCKIQPDELLGQEFSKKGAHALNVRAMSTLSTRLTGWIAETILNEQDTKKRAGLLKYFIKLSERCLHLDNYNTLMAVLCALTSSTISRLRKTWDGLSSKYRIILDTLRKATEHGRNYAEYRAKIRSAVPPCLPFVGLFLTDLTFCYEGNRASRPSPLDPSLSLINLDRYQKMSRIVGDLQRFQVPYNLAPVPEIQSYLSMALDGIQNGGDVSTLYRQSLLLEPRDNTAGPPPPKMGPGVDPFNWRVS
ncbi:hypothetical protein RQP46_000739 [Phenoliferia psychrophenolica]